MGSAERRINIYISIIALICVGLLDYLSNDLMVILFYVSLIAATANAIDGKYAYWFAAVAITIRIIIPEVDSVIGRVPTIGEILLFDSNWARLLWSFLNIYGANFLLVHIILRKNIVTAQLRQSSLTDPLTNLLNRRGFEQRLEFYLAHSRRHHEHMSIAYIDVDRFKSVNDRYGHATGDELLICIGEQITHALRVDDVVARLGGDEFAIIFTQSDDSISLIERIKHDLDAYCSKRKEFDVSFSIGIVHYDGKQYATGDEVTRYADELMYEVKKTSKNAILRGYFQRKNGV